MQPNRHKIPSAAKTEEEEEKKGQKTIDNNILICIWGWWYDRNEMNGIYFEWHDERVFSRFLNCHQVFRCARHIEVILSPWHFMCSLMVSVLIQTMCKYFHAFSHHTSVTCEPLHCNHFYCFCISVYCISFVEPSKKTLMSQTFGKSKMPHFLFLITAWHWIRFVSFVLAYDMFNLCAFQLAGRFFSHLNILIFVLYIQLFSSYDYMIFFFWFTWFAQTKLIISRKKGEYIILLYIYIFANGMCRLSYKRAYTIPLRMGYCPTPYDLVVLFHKWKRL